jgi:predicted ABC-type ATPase
MPLLVMVAGPNGSGKSTLNDALRAAPDVQLPALYVNADELQRQHGLADPIKAQQLAAALRQGAIDRGHDVMYETVMSHPSKVAELQAARAKGFEVVVHFVATDDPAINVERVALRVAAGGHDVPVDRTCARYERTMSLAPLALSQADDATVWDNSRRGDEGGLQLQARLVGRRLELLADRPTPWVSRLVDTVNERVAELDQHRIESLQRGIVLSQADFTRGYTKGPVVALGEHFAVQADAGSAQWVLHERRLLGDAPLAIGQVAEIRYRDGVADLGRAPERSPDQTPER